MHSQRRHAPSAPACLCVPWQVGARSRRPHPSYPHWCGKDGASASFQTCGRFLPLRMLVSPSPPAHVVALPRCWVVGGMCGPPSCACCCDGGVGHGACAAAPVMPTCEQVRMCMLSSACVAGDREGRRLLTGPTQRRCSSQSSAARAHPARRDSCAVACAVGGVPVFSFTRVRAGCPIAMRPQRRCPQRRRLPTHRVPLGGRGAPLASVMMTATPNTLWLRDVCVLCKMH